MAETQDNYASSCTVVKVAPDAPAIKKGRQKSPTPISSTPGSPSKAAGSALATPTLFHTDSKGPLETGNILRGDDLQIKLLEEIGAGSFAKVFRAEEIESGLVVAAKVFTEGDFDLGAHETRQALAEHEYNVVGFLNHENIVRVHGLLLTPTTVCILQELVTHGDLFTAVDAGYGLPADHVVSVIQGVGAALRYLHDPSVNMVHLDIKPENVLLTESGVPKLCDFDTAMKIGSEPSTMRGTPEYQSPESIPGSHDYHVVIESFSVGGGYPVHPALDIWVGVPVASPCWCSACVSVHECSTAHTPRDACIRGCRRTHWWAISSCLATTRGSGPCLRTRRMIALSKGVTLRRNRGSQCPHPFCSSTTQALTGDARHARRSTSCWTWSTRATLQRRLTPCEICWAGTRLPRMQRRWQ
eukprot:m.325922 g.325922  ORF g.325922 m.325922 type:complete len:414 (+) comp20391_c0_seq6:289-1530(+)